MKLLINLTCAQADRSTGIERFALHLSRELVAIDPSAVIVASEQMPWKAEVVVPPSIRWSKTLLKKREYFFRALWDQTILHRYIARYNSDVVFFPIQDGLFYSNAKQIVTVHDFDALMPECRQEVGNIRKKIYQYKIPHILKRSEAIVTVSEFTKQGIVTSLDISPDKIYVIHNGYDESRFLIIQNPQPVLHNYGLQSGKYYLFIGSILKHKNILGIVRAFSRIKSEAMLVIAGTCKDRTCFSEIQNLVADLNISDVRFRYIDYVADNDLPYLYNGAIALLLPSFHEGFGVPIIEAMACGTPVITSSCTAMPEVAGNAALLVDPYSVESIAAAMKEVLYNPERAEQLKKAGLERVTRFRWSYSARKLYELCQRISES